MREKRKETLKKRGGLLAAAGVSFALHGALIASGWNGWGWLEPILPKQAADQTPREATETILLPVEIKHFYSDWKTQPQEKSISSAQKILFEGPGWMKKMEAPSSVTDEVTYASYVRDLIVAQLSYPPSLKKEGREVWVRVAFSLDRRGKVLRLEIAADMKATNNLFNAAALEAVHRAAAAFPPFPPSVRKPDQRFSFLLLFRPDMS